MRCASLQFSLHAWTRRRESNVGRSGGEGHQDRNEEEGEGTLKEEHERV